MGKEDSMTYREEVLRTCKPYNNLVHGALGLAGEAGEVVDELKKHIVYGKTLDRDKVLMEMGDVRWYLELLCIALESSIEELEYLNISKLRKRYP